MARQNIYDDPAFFAGYATLPRFRHGLDAVFEWPAFRRMLPPSLQDLRVLDLGCGIGHFARWARSQGAGHVLGVDLSEQMLQRARTLGNDSAITYRRSALEDFVPDSDSFDLVTSSLALHYIADYALVVRRVTDCLVPGGRFVFSVEHPIFSARAAADWHIGPKGERLHWPVDYYRDEGARQTHWFVDGVVRYHRTVETYVNGLIDAGLRLTRLAEPEAEGAFLAAWPEAVEERRRPPFLLLAADRPRL